MEGVELEDLDAGVEVPWCVGSAGGGFGWGAEAFGCGGLVEVVGEVEVGGSGGGEVVF